MVCFTLSCSMSHFPHPSFVLHYLSVRAVIAADRIRDAADCLSAHKVIDKGVLLSMPMTEYIPLEIRDGHIYPSYLKGYSAVFGAIARVLVGIASLYSTLMPVIY